MARSRPKARAMCTFGGPPGLILRMEFNRHLLAYRALSIGVLAGLTLLATPLGAQKDGAIPQKADAVTIVHVLNRIGFGPKPGDVARVQQMGLSAYIDQQLHPERINDSALDQRLAAFETLNMSSSELADKYFMPAMEIRRQAQQSQTPKAQARKAPPSKDGGPDDAMQPAMQPNANDPQAALLASLTPEERQAVQAQRTVITDLTQAKMLRAVESERQLQEVMADFWLNHFNVFIGKGQVRDFLTEYDRDTIRPHVLGSFREILGAVAHSSAMLFYLDNWQSSTPTPAMPENMLRQRPNGGRLTPQQQQRLMGLQRPPNAQQPQRQMRGINENYARELMELHTLGVDGGYTQDDVIALARILTGWTIDRPRQGGGFVFRPAMHDTGTKKLLGVTFGNDGEREGERALDLLAQQPATARHISFKLAQRFVADEPPAALVDRATKTFVSTKGDIREVVRTIITSPEFFATETQRGKVKTPLEFIASAARVTGATVTNAQPLVAAMQNLGMPLYGCQPPTGYGMTAVDWVNTGALLNRMNFAVQLVSGGRVQPQQPAGRGAGALARLDAQGRGRGPGPEGRPAGRGLAAAGRGPIQVDLEALAPDTSSTSQTTVVDSLLTGHASDATRQTLARAGTPQNLVALALGSPEFQRR
jgi:uncharacterized protein (DUF1800 family)